MIYVHVKLPVNVAVVCGVVLCARCVMSWACLYAPSTQRNEFQLELLMLICSATKNSDIDRKHGHIT